jgi:hypothetical protein
MNRNTLQSTLAVLIAGYALASPGAAAEESTTLYKCVDAKGVVSIQAKACPAGSKQSWQRPAQTEPKQTEQDLAAAREREKLNQQRVSELSAELNKKMAEQAAAEQLRLQAASQPPVAAPAPGPGGTPFAASGPCQQAQSFMAAVREKTWIGMTDEQMKRIYSWVADQCRVTLAPTAQ